MKTGPQTPGNLYQVLFSSIGVALGRPAGVGVRPVTASGAGRPGQVTAGQVGVANSR